MKEEEHKRLFTGQPVGEKRVITLITDFGVASEYAGVMKGVLLTINPSCQIVDITHGIAPQDREEAAFILYNAYTYFPQGTIHLVVVDPGVGGERKPVVVKTDNYLFVGPDNGVFSFIYRTEGFQKAWQITHASYLLPRVSTTFHGRDIFAPVAAHLSTGVSPEVVGVEHKNLVVLSDLEAKIEQGGIRGRVVYADHFGNLVSNISRDVFEKVTAGKQFRIVAGGSEIERVVTHYGEAGEQEVVALFGSSGWLELSIKNGSCQKKLDTGKGTSIEEYCS